MLLVVTSSTDPELALLKSRLGVALVVPAHLSQPGWSYHVGSGAQARLVTSQGTIAGASVSGVLTRTQRAWPAELPHIDPEDREYVASEITAFLAALLNELPCPLFNRPAAGSLWGPPWTDEHWWRAATAQGLSVCRNDDRICNDSAQVVVLGGKIVRGAITEGLGDLAVQLAAHAGVLMMGAKFCVSHRALQRVSLQPPLDEDLLDAIEHYCGAARRIP